ncbi:MAG: LssY C-terminal domain-containing protein [Candidatus Saccharibacteria bacterium]|nr:LssY C-terminal domain-containing protein [Candidatus Saccharibacteria bacterium]
MIHGFVRIFKRFIVLLPGLVVAYFATTGVFPFFDQRLPAVLAILFAYVLAAYVLIPALLRLVRFFVRPKHIPHYCVTGDGFASDPINIGLVGSKEQVTRAMKKAGWYGSDRRTVKSIARLVYSVIFRKKYLTAPFSYLYLFGRKQDIGFQLPVGDSPHTRHHVRFWLAGPTLSKEHRAHLDFWDELVHGKKRKAPRDQLWLGAASRDIGIGFIRHNAQFTHSVHPDTDAERNLIVKSLKKTGLVKRVRNIMVGEAYKLRNRVFRSHLRSDGKLTIIRLK